MFIFQNNILNKSVFFTLERRGQILSLELTFEVMSKNLFPFIFLKMLKFRKN